MAEQIINIVEIKNLKQLVAKNPNASMPLYNPETDRVERILVADLVGGETVKVPWIITKAYEKNEIAEFNNKFWKSLQDNNIGHQPYEDLTWWTEVSASTANGTALQPWAAGIFNIVNSSVTVDNVGYLLNNTVPLPFESTDFPTELAANKWLPLGSSIVVATNADMDDGTSDTTFVSPLKFVYGIVSRAFSQLKTTAKTIAGAINELFDLKQRANPSWDLSTVPKAEDLVIDEGAKTITFGSINGVPLSVGNPAIYRIDQIDGTSKKYLITSPQVFTYTATYGIWWIYFGDSGGVIVNGGALQFGRMAPLLRFVYSTDDNVINTRVAEFHPDTLSAVAHKRAHSEGTVWISGGDVTANPITTGAPNADGRNTVIGLSSVTNMDDNFEYTVQNSTGGGNWQQDLGTNVAASLSSANSGIFNITYNQATGSRLRVIQGTRYPFPWNVATNRPQTISELGVFTEVPNNYFFCSFIYVLQDFKTGEAVRLRTSTVAFATIEEARAYSWDTLKGFSPTLSDNEIRQHLKCIWEVKTAWSASCKYAALRETQYLRQNPLTTVTAGSVSTTASNTSVVTPTGYTATDVQGLSNEFAARIDLLESIFFDDITVKAKISRPYNFTVSVKTESGGTGTITTSANAAYTLGATITANDYVQVAASAVNTRVFLTLTRV